MVGLDLRIPCVYNYKYGTVGKSHAKPADRHCLCRMDWYWICRNSFGGHPLFPRTSNLLAFVFHIYNDLMQQTEQLQTDIEQLQDRKETAQEELRRDKKEVQTKKLKGAATTVVTNIAESVGSLFGSNKVKTLEKENTALQNRISELENEAQEREERQAQQMQDMKSTYEQQNRKLSEFVDFVKRYFPYVEKLIPTIKFLRETLNFGDAIIRKLCTFKDVPIKGELYSREFNQHFRADGAVCSLKQNAEERFDLNIDGVSNAGSGERKTSLWKYWECLQRDKIRVLGCKSK